jgi:hypothetical protein
MLTTFYKLNDLGNKPINIVIAIIKAIKESHF